MYNFYMKDFWPILRVELFDKLSMVDANPGNIKLCFFNALAYNILYIPFAFCPQL